VTASVHDPDAAHEALRSMEAQLVALYEEKAQAPDLAAMVTSLEAQVCALIDEKAELQRQLDARPGSALPPMGVPVGAA
jgi:hypothetical protein